MKKSISTAVFTLMSMVTMAQCDTTYLSGNQLIDENTTLSGVYFVSGNYIIDEGVTVTVKPFSSGGCGKLEIHATNIVVKGMINGDYAGYLGGSGGNGGTTVTSATGHSFSLTSCEDKENGGVVTVQGGMAGLNGQGQGAGLAGANATNGSGPKQVCGNTDDTYGMIAGGGGAGGGGGASYGGLGKPGSIGGKGSSSHSASNNNVSNQHPIVAGNGGNGGANGAIVGTESGPDIDLGSGGAGAGGGGRSYASGQNASKGGNGGGLVILEATNDIEITGTITVNGQNGAAGGNGGRGDATPKCCSDGCDDCGEATYSAGAGGGAGAGAGSGGGILIRSTTAAISGNLSSMGGNGGNGGVGGAGTSCTYGGNLFCSASSVTTNAGENGGKGGDASGGRIKIFIATCSSNQVTPNVSVNGGATAEAGTFVQVCQNQLGIENQEIVQFSVFPNPLVDMVTIQLMQDPMEKTFVKVVDTKGSIVDVTEFEGTTTQLTTTSWNEGLYFLEMTVGGKKITSKIVKK